MKLGRRSSPTHFPMPKTDKHAEARFLEKVKIEGEGHWLWEGSINQAGYGRFWYKTVVWLAHRWAFTHWRGNIPPYHVLDHTCKIHHCVNPDHVQPVPLAVNTARGDSITAQNTRKDACKWGHPFTPSNTYSPPGSKTRMCKACLKRNNQQHYRKHPGQFQRKNDSYRARNPQYDRNRYQSQKAVM